MTQGRATQILDNLIAQGKAKPMIAVFTNGNISQEAAPLENSMGYVNPTMSLPQTMEGTFEHAFPEIVDFIDSHFRTIAKKQSRAICGLSMGGFHTLYTTMNNPDMFNYSGMFSAAIGTGSERQAAHPEIYDNLTGNSRPISAKSPRCSGSESARRIPDQREQRIRAKLTRPAIRTRTWKPTEDTSGATGGSISPNSCRCCFSSSHLLPRVFGKSEKTEAVRAVRN